MRANLSCEICQLEAGGLHFGVASCRACAAFFRRSVVLKLAYKCQKEHNCDVTKKQRFSCRCCRFQKCLDRGMRPSMVQPNASDKNDTAHSSSLLSEVSTPPSTTSGRFEASPSSSGIPDMTQVVSGVTPPERSLILEKQKALRIKVDTLFETHNTLSSFILPIKLSLIQQGLVALNDHLQKWPLCTPEHVKQGEPFTLLEVSMNIDQEIENIAVFCMSLDDFAHLDKDQKWALFKRFWNNFVALERYKAAARCLGKPPLGLWLNYNGCYYDFHKNADWTRDSPEVKKFVEFITPSCLKEMHLLGNQLQRMEPTDFELVFCMLQTMWSVKRDTIISETTAAMADSVKRRLAQEVHDYYTVQMKRTNYAARLMQMMSIVASLDEIEQQRREDRTVCRTFELCKEDLFYSEFADY
ncbi:unnamed protein product, partial [Mesorhabditis spiculigera]